MTRDTAFLAELITRGFSPQEVSLVSFPRHLSSCTRKQLYCRLQQAYASGSLPWLQRLHALLALAQDQSVSDVAERWSLGEQPVRAYRHQYLFQGPASLVYQAPPGRPSTRTTTQRHQLAEWVKASPQDSGYTSGCWHTPRMQDLIQRHFGVVYHPHSSATWLNNRGFSSQKARFVSAHRNEAKRLAWRQRRWPQLLRQAKQRNALRLFGAEASFAQWGSLSDTWALRGPHPEGPTSGKRQACKVLGLIEYFSGRFFYTAHGGRFNSQSDAAF